MTSSQPTRVSLAGLRRMRVPEAVPTYGVSLADDVPLFKISLADEGDEQPIANGIDHHPPSDESATLAIKKPSPRPSPPRQPQSLSKSNRPPPRLAYSIAAKPTPPKGPPSSPPPPPPPSRYGSAKASTPPLPPPAPSSSSSLASSGKSRSISKPTPTPPRPVTEAIKPKQPAASSSPGSIAVDVLDAEVQASLARLQQRSSSSSNQKPLDFISISGWLRKGSHRLWAHMKGGILRFANSQDSEPISDVVAYLSRASVRLIEMRSALCIELSTLVETFWLYTEDKGREVAVDWLVALKYNVEVLAQRVVDDAAASDLHLPGNSLKAQDWVGVDVVAAPADEGVEPGLFYHALGISPSASFEDARREYQALCKNLHPDDKHSSDPARFALIDRAFVTLCNPFARARYDLALGVRSTLRARGVACDVREPSGDTWHACVYLGRALDCMFLQDRALGSVLQPGFRPVELRLVHAIVPGEHAEEWNYSEPTRGMLLKGQGVLLRLEMNSTAERDDLLEGLRALCVERSVVFNAWLENWLASGNR